MNKYLLPLVIIGVFLYFISSMNTGAFFDDVGVIQESDSIKYGLFSSSTLLPNLPNPSGSGCIDLISYYSLKNYTYVPKVVTSKSVVTDKSDFRIEVTNIKNVYTSKSICSGFIYDYAVYKNGVLIDSFKANENIAWGSNPCTDIWSMQNFDFVSYSDTGVKFLESGLPSDVSGIEVNFNSNSIPKVGGTCGNGAIYQLVKVELKNDRPVSSAGETIVSSDVTVTDLVEDLTNLTFIEKFIIWLKELFKW